MSEELKVCRKCHLELPVTEFVVKDKRTGYRGAQCRACEAERVRGYYHSNQAYREKQLANNRKQNAANPRTPEQARKYSLKFQYGIAHGDYERLLAAQNGACALCGSTDSGRVGTKGKWASKHFNVDHCHKDGRVRGLLCHPCNAQLGGYETLLEKVGEDKLLDYVTAPSPLAALPVLSVDPRATARFVADLPPRYISGPPCSVEGCGKPSTSRGLCPTHYRRLQRTGTPGTAAPLAHTSAKGEAHPKSKLSAEQVAVIKGSKAPGVALALEYGVTPALISNIRLGKTWAHVEPVKHE